MAAGVVGAAAVADGGDGAGCGVVPDVVAGADECWPIGWQSSHRRPPLRLRWP